MSVRTKSMYTERESIEPVLLNTALEFTQAHRDAQNKSKCARELGCLKTLFPSILLGPKGGDVLVGRIAYPLAGFSNVYYPEKEGLDLLGYYFDKERAERIYKVHNNEVPFTKEDLDGLEEYWKENRSYNKTTDVMDKKMRRVLSTNDYIGKSSICHRLHRIASPSIDFHKLLKFGIRGYKEKLRFRLHEILKEDLEGIEFLGAACEYMDLFSGIVEEYIFETEKNAGLIKTTEALKRLLNSPPNSFIEALQLVHLYATTGYMAQATGRIDDDLGVFYVNDIRNGDITKEEAIEWLLNYFQLFSEHFPNSRLTMGGLGRRNVPEADEFCKVLLETTKIYFGDAKYRDGRRRSISLVPQVAFRFSKKTPRELLDQAYSVIASGATFPILYNDDINIDAVSNAFDISKKDAAQYNFFDCGEYIIHGKSIGTPSTIVNLPKALEVTLHNGMDPKTGKRLGPENPNLDFRHYQEASIHRGSKVHNFSVTAVLLGS
ncbi:MAG: hypothetical protein HQL32_07540 [Planctomycetes bacterium]|nr:hypothetical protein [Planctomycetota bacterium]